MRISLFHQLSGLTTLGAIALMAASPAHGFTLDPFTDAQTVRPNDDIGPTFGSGQVAGSGIVGGFREANLTVPPNAVAAGDSIEVAVGSGLLSLNNSSGDVASTFTLTYDGAEESFTSGASVDVDGLCSLDCLNLTGHTGLSLQNTNGVGTDESGTFSVLFSLFDGTSGLASTFTFTRDITSTNSGDVFEVVAPFSSFTPGLDLANIGAIQVTFSGPAGFDASFGPLVSTPVPEPLTLVGTGAALGLGVLLEQRRKRQA